MGNSRRISEIINYYGKGVTPKYVDKSSIIVLNQKCVRNNKIDYKFAQYIDDSKKYNEVKFLKVGDILVNSTGQGTAGRVAFVSSLPDDKQVIVDSHILVLRVDNFFEAQCLNYNLFFIEKTLQSFMDGSTGQGEFDKIRLFNISVNYPKNSFTQQKIASVLSALDDKIELNNKINAELEAMAKTLYDYWFVQFDFPNPSTSSGQVGKPYKSSGGEMVYDEVLKREIPKGWEVKSLFDTCDVQYGFPFNTSHFNEKKMGKPVIRIRDILENSISTYSSQDNIEEKYKLLAGDLLVGMDGNFHLNFWSKNDCYLNQRIVRIREKNGLIPNFVTLFQIEPFIKLREKSVSRTTVGHLSDKDLKSINMLAPTKSLSKHFKIFDELLSKTVSNKKQNQELASLRDWLLPMLMNGQVTVAGAYEEVKEKLAMVAEGEVKYGE